MVSRLDLILKELNDDPLPNIPSNYFYLMDNDTVKWKHV